MATNLIDYSSLQQRIIEESDRDDIGSEIPSFIYEAETEMWQDLRLRVMQRRYTSVTPTDTRYMSVPDRYLDMYRVFITGGSGPKLLRAASPAAILEKYQPGGSIPDYFCVTGFELEFERVPGSELPIEMTFYQAPYNLGYQAGNAELNVNPPKIPDGDLDTTNVVISNEVLRLLPSVYLYASMIKVGLYTHDETMVARYSGPYDQAVAKANRNARDGRVTGGPISAFNAVGSP